MICTTVTRPSDQRKTQLPITPQDLGSRHTARELPLPAGLHLSPVPTRTSHAPALTQLILHPLPSATPLCLECPPTSSSPGSHRRAPKGCHLFINLPPNPVSSPPLCSPSILRIFYHCTEIVIYVSFSSRDQELPKSRDCLTCVSPDPPTQKALLIVAK